MSETLVFPIETWMEYDNLLHGKQKRIYTHQAVMTCGSDLIARMVAFCLLSGHLIINITLLFFGGGRSTRRPASIVQSLVHPRSASPARAEAR